VLGRGDSKELNRKEESREKKTISALEMSQNSKTHEEN
jgi:hypothetical protein